MGKIKEIILLSICIIVFSSCNSEFDTIPKEQKVILEKTNQITIEEEEVETLNLVSANDINRYEGVYEYKYEHNTESLTEDHYIVLKYVNGTLQGTYYGTSDDFDDAQEGYYPGFFVSDMRNLQINDNTIVFNLQLRDSDVFTKPIDLNYKSSQDVPSDENPKWDIGLRKYSRDYNGEIVNGEIQLEVEFGTRVFKKIW